MKNKFIISLLPFCPSAVLPVIICLSAFLPFCLSAQNKGVVYEKASGGLSVAPILAIDSSGGSPPRTISISVDGGTPVQFLDLSGGAAASPTTITPSQITSDQDNYNPTGIGKATYVYLSGDNGIRAITGIADSVAGTLRKTIVNTGTLYPFYLSPNHPDSDAAHRILSPSDGDFMVHPGQSIEILYDVTNSGWRILTPRQDGQRETVYYEQSAASQTAGDNSDIAFSAIGTGTVTHTAATTTFPACYLLSTSTNATWGYSLYFAKGLSQFTSYASSHKYIEATLSLPVLSDGTDTYTTEVQLYTAPAGATNLEVNNTIGVRYSHGINSGEWELFCQDNAGSEGTPADLNVAVAANTLYKIRIEHDQSNSEARAYINGAYCGRVTNMPADVVMAARIVHLKSVGTTARTCQVHHFKAGAIYPQ